MPCPVRPIRADVGRREADDAPQDAEATLFVRMTTGSISVLGLDAALRVFGPEKPVADFSIRSLIDKAGGPMVR